MEYKCFKYSLEDHIAHVTLSRGDELNTMIKEFWSELPDLIDEISNEGEASPSFDISSIRSGNSDQNSLIIVLSSSPLESVTWAM